MVKHLLMVLKDRFQGDAGDIDEEYVELLYELVVPKDDLKEVEGILDFVEVLQRRFSLLIENDAPTILLIEPLS